MIWGYPYFWKHPYPVILIHLEEDETLEVSLLTLLTLEGMSTDLCGGKADTQIVTLVAFGWNSLLISWLVNQPPRNVPPPQK